MSILAAAVLALAALHSMAAPVAAQEVNLYTTREPGLIKPLLDTGKALFFHRQA